MRIHIHTALALLATLVSSFGGYAGAPLRCARPSIGPFSSIKGVGVSYQIPKDKEFESFALYTEIYGIPTGRCSSPGVKFNYSHNLILNSIDYETARLSFYVGPGVSAGYMRDAEIGKYEGTEFTLTRNPGFMAALSGTGGCHFDFNRNIALDLSFTAELGIHVRRDEKVNSMDLNFYRNGLLQALYPQLSILFHL